MNGHAACIYNLTWTIECAYSCHHPFHLITTPSFSSLLPSHPVSSSPPFLLLPSAASRDLEGARSVLTMMKEKDITAGTESYGALAAAFAERGDMEGVEKVSL